MAPVVALTSTVTARGRPLAAGHGAPTTDANDFARRSLVKGEKKKQSLYFPVEMLSEMQSEADRQERPLSWIMQQAWKLSRQKIATYPGVEDL
jgi:uncharacterized small protein (TIGR04563 family)